MTDAKIELQLALDCNSTAEAMNMAEQAYPYFNIVEIGTPLIIEDGLRAVETLKAAYPDKKCLADTKIADAGYCEASAAFRRGADIVTVLGVSDDITIKQVCKAAVEFRGLVMADLMHVPDKVARSSQLESLGVEIICLHTAYDLQSEGMDPLAELSEVRAVIGCTLAIAGGLKLKNIDESVARGANILVVGAGITGQDHPGKEAQRIMDKLSGGTN